MFQGLDIVPPPPVGPLGIAWEFTAQPVETCFYVDSLFNSKTCGTLGQLYLTQLALAQTSAPFNDGLGLVASTLPDGTGYVPPLKQCLDTPFQCIIERVGVAATDWAIFAEQKVNPLDAPVAQRSESWTMHRASHRCSLFTFDVGDKASLSWRSAYYPGFNGRRFAFRACRPD